MNETLQNILNRRSIRKYKNRQIPKNIVEDLLKAGMSAPSACNQQVWHFVVITKKEVLNELSNIHSGYTTLKNSPLAILVCGEPDAAKLKNFWEHDCAAATQNILIAAKSLALGAVWLGVNSTSEKDPKIISRILNLPENIKPFSFISAGYPDETLDPSNKYSETKIHYNSIW